MKKLVFIITLGLMLPMEAGALTMHGQYSCGSWVSEKNSNIKAYQKGWLLGFLSGLSGGLGEEFMKRTDSDSVFLWVDNYCKANPLKDSVDAAYQLTVELQSKH